MSPSRSVVFSSYLDIQNALVYPLGTMYEILVAKRRAFLGLAFCCAVVLSSAGFAADLIPIPSFKPDAPVQVQAVQIQDEALSLLQFGTVAQAAPQVPQATQALLQFGVPPVPKPRPMPTNLEPLSPDAAHIYERIFSYQARGEMSKANKELLRLKDFRLRGHVLYQRYMHPTAYKASYEDLRNWLALYADHPGSSKIYKMARKRQPKGSGSDLKKPQSLSGIARVREPTVSKGQKYYSPRKRNANQKAQINDLKKAVRRDLNRRAPSEALRRLEGSLTYTWLDSVEQDILKSQIAASYFYAGKLEEAYDLAAQSVRRSGVHVPVSGWVAGLVSWREGHYDRAAKHFAVTARSPYASGWSAAAGSYWAARAHMRTGNVRAVSSWLSRASEHPRTFYGLIATRALGRDFDFNWDIPTYTKESHDLLMGITAGYRAISLVAAGQVHLAEAELLRMDSKKNTELRNALLAYAGYAGLPGLAMRLGNTMSMEDGGFYDAALYPTGPWKPKEGYKIDPALIHAIMRQESRFDQMAKSPSGARGLMQIMPNTADHVAGRKQYKDRSGKQKLMDPQTNLELGQRYLEELLDQRYVNGDLFALLVAYNAGPGNLSRWKRSMPDIEDPLMFVESIPVSETRAYVERVLANYWIYRLREDLQTPTLDSVAAGQAAQYVVVDENGEFRLAARP